MTKQYEATPSRKVAFLGLGVMGGLVIATALTLLALPAMYAAWFRVHKEG